MGRWDEKGLALKQNLKESEARLFTSWRNKTSYRHFAPRSC